MWHSVLWITLLGHVTHKWADGTISYFSLKCQQDFQLHPTSIDVTYDGVSKMRCLEYCKRHAEDEVSMKDQCKSISYSAAAAAGGRCVLSPLRLFSSQSVDAVQGWTVCTQHTGE